MKFDELYESIMENTRFPGLLKKIIGKRIGQKDLPGNPIPPKGTPGMYPRKKKQGRKGPAKRAPVPAKIRKKFPSVPDKKIAEGLGSLLKRGKGLLSKADDIPAGGASGAGKPPVVKPDQGSLGPVHKRRSNPQGAKGKSPGRRDPGTLFRYDPNWGYEKPPMQLTKGGLTPAEVTAKGVITKKANRAAWEASPAYQRQKKAAEAAEQADKRAKAIEKQNRIEHYKQVAASHTRNMSEVDKRRIATRTRRLEADKAAGIPTGHGSVAAKAKIAAEKAAKEKAAAEKAQLRRDMAAWVLQQKK